MNFLQSLAKFHLEIKKNFLKKIIKSKKVVAIGKQCRCVIMF